MKRYSSIRGMLAGVVVLVMLFMVSGPSLHACTAFVVKCSDGVVTGRSYDYGRYTGFETQAYDAGETLSSVYRATPSSPSFTWKATEAFITVNNVLNDPAGYLVAFEGMNKAGISISGNLADAEYPADIPNRPTLSSDDIVRYVLSQASSIDDVKRLLGGINIVSRWKYHYIIFDRDGNSLVAEFRNGSPVFFDNKTPILTNNPNLDFQMANLNNFSNLKVYNKGAITPGSGNQYHGAGMFGLPGDWMSPSRFARGHFMVVEGQKYVTTTDEALGLAARVVDSVSLIKGIDTGSSSTSKPIYTQIQILKDVASNTIYMKQYSDFQWKHVSY